MRDVNNENEIILVRRKENIYLNYILHIESKLNMWLMFEVQMRYRRISLDFSVGGRSLYFYVLHVVGGMF